MMAMYPAVIESAIEAKLYARKILNNRNNTVL